VLGDAGLDFQPNNFPRLVCFNMGPKPLGMAGNGYHLGDISADQLLVKKEGRSAYLRRIVKVVLRIHEKKNLQEPISPMTDPTPALYNAPNQRGTAWPTQIQIFHLEQ
jgi:hypothetical protein